MQTSLEVLAGLKRRLKIILPSEVFSAQHEKSIKKIASKAKVDGFRKGKVPEKVLLTRFAHEILEEAINNLVHSSLYEAYQKEEIVPVSQPVIDIIQAELGKPFEYTAEFEIAPKIEKVNFAEVAIEKIVTEVGTEQIDASIQNMAQQFGAFELKEGSCAEGDRVTIDFIGSIDGVLFDGGQAEGYAFILGKGQMLPEFEAGVLGMKAGDEKTIDVTFPENYHADLAGKCAQFKVTLHQVEEKVAAPIDEALAKRVGIASGDVDQLKEEVKKALVLELNKKLREDLHKKIFDKLVELNQIEVPDNLVHEEIHYLMEDAQKRFQEMTGKKEALNLPHEMFTEQAKKRIQTSYLIAKLVEVHDLKPDTAEIRKLAEEMAASYENPTQVRDHFLTDKKYYRNLENMVIENAVVSVLLDQAVVTTIEKSYAEVIVRS